MSQPEQPGADTLPNLAHTLSLPAAPQLPQLSQLPSYARPSETDFTHWVNAAFKTYHSVLALARSPLANSPLIIPLLVLDDVSPTAEERGQALRLLLQWAVQRLAPAPAPYPIGAARPLDDPTWRDSSWWRYNILRHRYLEPLHPDEFVEGGRFTETIIALTGIPSPDTFFDERNRAIQEVAQWLWQQLAHGQANEELQQLALAEAYRPLQTQPAAHALLGVAAVFDDVFPRTLLLQMAAHENLLQAEAALNYLTEHRFLLMGDAGANLWLSPVLRQYIYTRQPKMLLMARHQQAARYYAAEQEPLSVAKHLQQAQQWSEAAAVLFRAKNDLMDDLQFEELCELLLAFQSNHLPAGHWRELQIWLSDLYSKLGRHEDALAACRRALRASEEPGQQARIYRRMGKLYEKHNQLHALSYYQQALERFTLQDAELLDLLKDRAWLYILRQEWGKAETDLRMALTHAPEMAGEQRANIYDALASLYRHQKRYEQALQFAQKALALREEIGDALRVADSFNNLGLLYNYMGEYSHAIAAHEEAMAVYRRLKNQGQMAAVLLNVGMARHLSGNLPAAIESYRQSLALSQEISLPLAEVRARYNLAEALAELGQAEEARRHWRAGHTLSIQARFDDEAADFLKLLEHTPALQMAEPGTQQPPAALQPLQAVEPDEQLALEIVRREGRISPKTLMAASRMSKATATRRLAHLLERGYLHKHGQGRGTYYTLAEGAIEPPAPVAATRSMKPTVHADQLQPILRQQHPLLVDQYAIADLGLACSERSSNGRLYILARFTTPPALRQFFELETFLSNLLHLEVDLLPADSPKAKQVAKDVREVRWVWQRTEFQG